MSAMTSLERTLTVLHHSIPDRVPVDLHNFLPAIAYIHAPLSAALQDGTSTGEAGVDIIGPGCTACLPTLTTAS